MVPNQISQTIASRQIADGMTVYGSDGEKLGMVRHYDAQHEFLDVQKGWLFHKDFYIGVGAVDTVTEDGITLRVNKHELESGIYSSPPPGSVAYNEGLAFAEKEPVDVVVEEVLVTRTADGPVS